MSTRILSRFYDVETLEEALTGLRAEVDNWTWLSREEKDRIVAEATARRTEAKFGPIYHISFKTPARN